LLFNLIHHLMSLDWRIKNNNIPCQYWKVCNNTCHFVAFCNAWFFPTLHFIFLVIWWDLFSWLYWYSFSICRISLIIFCSTGLLIINCFSFSLMWEVISPSVMSDNPFCFQGPHPWSWQLEMQESSFVHFVSILHFFF
jgi:hypothetical protein